MDIRISGKGRNGIEVQNQNTKGDIIPLSDYSSDELEAMIDSSTHVTIYLKDDTRVDDAKGILTEFFSHYKGRMESFATEYGWYVGQSLVAPKDDSTAFDKLRQSKAV